MAISPVPLPALIIRGFPRDDGIFRGLILTLMCLIEINPAVNTPVTVEGYLARNGTLLQDRSDGRVTVINSGLESPPYLTRVRFNSTQFEDAGTYNCSARIIPQVSDFILEAVNFVTRVITVLSKLNWLFQLACILYP